MKATHQPSLLKRTLFFLVLLIHVAGSLRAQEKEVQRVYAAADKGYWSLYTDPGKRSTTVKFFDQENDLIYQESLAGRYLKLTPQNIRKLNEMHSWYVASQLVSAQVRSMTLPMAPTPVNPAPGRFQTNIFPVFGTTRFKIAFDNPERKWVNISLQDAQGHELHRERVNQPSYVRSFNLDKVNPGTYKVILKAGKEIVAREINLQKVSQQFVQVYTPTLPAGLAAKTKRNQQR